MKRLAVLASGSGSNFESIVKACQSGVIQARVELLLTNSTKSFALERARQLGVPAVTISTKDYDSVELWDQAVSESLIQAKPDWVILAGFLKKLGSQTLDSFKNRIVNTHPSLLPKFGGEGMYGMNVHKAVIEAGEKVSGISVHVVSEEYDSGPVLFQKQVLLEPGETPDSLSEKVKAVENRFYVDCLAELVKSE